MFFTVKMSQRTVDFFCEILHQSQKKLARDIRMWNGIMRKGFEEGADALGVSSDVETFNERQKLLQKLVEQASDDFKKSLRPDDLKLWEELPLETRGLVARADEQVEVKRLRYRRFTLAMKYA